MGIFDDDPFEDLIREFFGEMPRERRRAFIKGESEERDIDLVEDEDYVYVIFELPGFEEEDVEVKVEGRNLEIIAQKSRKDCEKEKVKEYLTKKLVQGVKIRKILPNFVIPRNFKHTFKNGVLEITFNKK